MGWPALPVARTPSARAIASPLVGERHEFADLHEGGVGEPGEVGPFGDGLFV